MEKRFFIRAVGSDVVKDYELMTEEEALALLECEYKRLISDHWDGSWFDEMIFDCEGQRFQITGEEYYQSMWLLPENRKTGPGFILEEIRRKTELADEFAHAYEFELQSMGVFDVTAQIRDLADQLEELLLVKDTSSNCS